jgi:hypothetical protein
MKDDPLFGLIYALSVMVAFGLGWACGRNETKIEAIKYGVAHYQLISPDTGETKFTWKTVDTNVVTR